MSSSSSSSWWSSVPPQSSSSSQNTNYTKHMIESIFSYKGNIMLAAIISLLLVILFVLLLHVYAKWFLERSRNRRRRATRRRRRISSLILSDSNNTTVTSHSNVLFTFDTASSKGVDPSVIDLIPLFVYEGSAYENGLECVICLSSFEEKEVGRSLPKCGHGFHVECIDTWLFTHVNCPICRTPVSCDKKVEEENVICLQNQVVGNEVVVVESQENVPSDQMGSGGDREDISLEIITVDHGQEFVDENANANASTNNGESTSSSNSSLGCSYSCSSLKRMLSKSRSERKVYPNFSESGS